MGCADSNFNYSLEELEIIKKEITLPYNNLPPLKIDLIHRKYSSAGVVNKNQFEEIRIAMGLEIVENSLTSKFFESFYKNDNYFLKDLILVGMLYSNGNFTEKAQLIFEALDQKDTERISMPELDELISEMIDISIQRIAILIPASDLTTHKHIKILTKGVEKATRKMRKLFNPTKSLEISQKEFINLFHNEECADLLTSRGIRRLLERNS